MKRKNPSRLSTIHLTLKPLNTLPNNEDRRGRGNPQNPYLSIQNGRKQKAWEVGVVVSPKDGLILMWHILTELSSAQSQSQSRFSLSSVSVSVAVSESRYQER